MRAAHSARHKNPFLSVEMATEKKKEHVWCHQNRLTIGLVSVQQKRTGACSTRAVPYDSFVVTRWTTISIIPPNDAVDIAVIVTVNGQFASLKSQVGCI